MRRLSAAARCCAPALWPHGTGRHAPHPSATPRISEAVLPGASRRAMIRDAGRSILAAASPARRFRIRSRLRRQFERMQGDRHDYLWQPPPRCRGRLGSRISGEGGRGSTSTHLSMSAARFSAMSAASHAVDVSKEQGEKKGLRT